MSGSLEMVIHLKQHGSICLTVPDELPLQMVSFVSSFLYSPIVIFLQLRPCYALSPI